MPEEESRQWTCEYRTVQMPNDTFRVISPDGFNFDMSFPGEMCVFLSLAANPTVAHNYGGTRFYVNSMGLMVLEDTDPWINKGFKYGDILGRVDMLALIVATEVRIRLQTYVSRERG